MLEALTYARATAPRHSTAPLIIATADNADKQRAKDLGPESRGLVRLEGVVDDVELARHGESCAASGVRSKSPRWVVGAGTPCTCVELLQPFRRLTTFEIVNSDSR
jgi:hypothetical protein